MKVRLEVTCVVSLCIMPFCLTLYLRIFSACRRHAVHKVRGINTPTRQQQMRVGLSVQMSRCVPCSGVSSLQGPSATRPYAPGDTLVTAAHALDFPPSPLTCLLAPFFPPLIQDYPLFKIILVTSQQEMITLHLGFPGGSVAKNLPANAGDTGLIPGSGISPREGNGNPL